MLKSHQISLRLLEDNDLEFLYSIENNPDNKKYGSRNVYLSKKTLKDYIKNSGADISVYGQQRFVIVLKFTVKFFKLFFFLISNIFFLI